MNGSLVSPMIDSLILSSGGKGSITSVTLGEVNGTEHVPSRCVSDAIALGAFLRAQWRAGLPRLQDLRFVFNLFRPNQHPDLIFPVPRWKWRLFALRSYLVARYYSVLFAAEAETHDEARVLVYYGARMLGVVMAFRRRGKPVLDVQHGYIGGSHNAYNRPEICATGSWLEPSGYVLWSKDFHERTPAMRSKFALYTDYAHLKVFGRSAKDPAAPPSVLLATQWGTPVPQFILDLVDQAPHVPWLVRLHPLESDRRQDLIPLLARPNVKLGVLGCSLAEELSNSSLQVTVNSSTVHEAAALGVPSLFTDPLGMERFVSEIDRGLAIWVDQQTAKDAMLRLLGQSGAWCPNTQLEAQANG